MTASSLPNRLTPAQAAARIGIGKSTLHRLRLQGHGPEYLQIGTRIHYEADKVEEYLQRQRRVPGRSTPGVSTPHRATA